VRVDAPQEVAREFGRGRLLEAGDLHPLRVHAGEDAADRAVLAPGVHRLQHDQQALAAFGVERLLELLEPLVPLLQQLLAGGLVAAERRRVAGVVVAQVELAAGLHEMAGGW